MLEAIRNRSKGPLAKIIIGLIIVPFAFAGVYSYFNVNTSNAVATVNGEDISLSEFDRSYRFQQQNWGENFDKYFNTDEQIQQFRNSVLQQMINQRLSVQALDDMGIRISDNQLRKVIIETSQFQDENGKFDADRYKLVVQSGGYSTQQYQAARKNDMASSQFLQTLEESNFVLKNEIDLNKKLQNQTRDIDYVIIPQQFYADQVDLTGEKGELAINSYYEMNKNRFSIPEKVSIEYLYLTKREASTVVISDGQVADYYNDNISSFESSEKRHVAHILIAVNEDADQDLITTAEQKIQDIQSRLQGGESFEDLAKQYSDDTLTAESGGDLDWIEKGMMSETFEDAAFSLTDTESVSAIVKSNFGFHLIKLIAVDVGGPKPLDELKQQIITTLSSQFVEDKFYDLKDSISEKAFEISDSLAEAAKSNGLLIKNTALFDGQFGIGLPAELQNQPAIITSAFSEDVLYEGLNSELIELSDGNAVVLRLKEHQQAGLSPVTEIRDNIVTILINQRAKAETEDSGEQIIVALNNGKSAAEAISVLPEQMPVAWQQQLALGREATEINTTLRNEVFRIPFPDDTDAVYKGILLNSGDYAVVKLSAVNEGEIVIDEKADAELKNKFMDYHVQAEIYNYLKQLDASANISRSVSNTNLVQ